MRILITGANGYIGKSLRNALRSKHYVTAITRKEVDLTKASEVKEFFETKHHFDVVLHCAAAGAANPREMDWSIADKNLIMYYNLLANQKHFSRFINFGSGAEIYIPDTPYGCSKKLIAKSIEKEPNFYSIRIFGVFDENELETRFIKASIKRYLSKSPIVIHQDRNMDFFSMEDLITVVNYFIESKQPVPTYDCTYGKTYKLSEIADYINKLGEHKVDVIIMSEEEAEPYVAQQWLLFNLDLKGLHFGITNTYNKLKNETN